MEGPGESQHLRNTIRTDLSVVILPHENGIFLGFGDTKRFWLKSHASLEYFILGRSK